MLSCNKYAIHIQPSPYYFKDNYNVHVTLCLLEAHGCVMLGCRVREHFQSYSMCFILHKVKLTKHQHFHYLDSYSLKVRYQLEVRILKSCFLLRSIQCPSHLVTYKWSECNLHCSTRVMFCNSTQRSSSLLTFTHNMHKECVVHP